MPGGHFRGTSVDQDGRWGLSDQKLMEKMTKEGKFASILSEKVNLKKVNLEVIKHWITVKVTDLLGFEDDILISLITNILEEKQNDSLDSYIAKKMQVDVTGFLAKQV